MPRQSGDCLLAPNHPNTCGLCQYWLFLSAIRYLGQIQLHTTLPGLSGARGGHGLPLLRGTSIPRAAAFYHASQNAAFILNGETEAGKRQCCLAPNHNILSAEIPRTDFFSSLRGPTQAAAHGLPHLPIHQGFLAPHPPERPPDWWGGMVWLPCYPSICGSFPSQLQANPQPLFNYDCHVGLGGEPISRKVGQTRGYKCL